MSGQLDMFPSGIGRPQFERLADCVGRASCLTPADLLREAESHLARHGLPPARIRWSTFGLRKQS